MTEIRIKNYQSIGDISFKIDGFTVITGKNNIGKSAIIRAINAALTNQTGTGFIRKGKKQTEVHIKRDNLDLEWKKGESAVYTVNGEVFSKLNRDVPEPLLKAGFRKIDLPDLKLNPLVAKQFEEIFLLDESGSVVTETLSYIYKLDTISTADSLCQKDLKNEKTLLKTREKDLQTLDEKLVPFKDFHTIKQEVSELKLLEKECLELERQIKELSLYEETLKRINSEISRFESIKNINIPDPIETKKLLGVYQEITALEVSLNRIKAETKKFQIVENLNIPESRETGDLLRSYQEILGFEILVKNHSREIKRLQLVDGIQIPDCTAIGMEIQRHQDFLKMFDDIRNLALSIKSKKASLDVLSPMEDLKTETVGQLIKEVEFLDNLEQKFKSTAQETKQARTDFQTVSDDLAKAEKEHDQYKVCPLCKKPL